MVKKSKSNIASKTLPKLSLRTWTGTTNNVLSAAESSTNVGAVNYDGSFEVTIVMRKIYSDLSAAPPENAKTSRSRIRQ